MNNWDLGAHQIPCLNHPTLCLNRNSEETPRKNRGGGGFLNCSRDPTPPTQSQEISSLTFGLKGEKYAKRTFSEARIKNKRRNKVLKCL